MRVERDAVRELVAAVEQWDNAGKLKVMHVLTCAECKRLEKDEERWCSQAQAIGRRQIEAAQLLKAALAPARAALAAHPAPAATAGEWKPHEIRRNQDGTVDEVVAVGQIHIEQMDTNSWWIGVETANGRRLRVNFHAKGKIKITVEDEGPSDYFAALQRAAGGGA